MSTAEQRTARERFTELLQSLDRVRIEEDAEGWPVVRGRYGDLEWHDEDTIAAYTAHGRYIAKRLLALPGVQPHQTGDHECRALVPLRVTQVHPQAILTGLQHLLRLRTRRVLSDAQRARLRELSDVHGFKKRDA